MSAYISSIEQQFSKTNIVFSLVNQQPGKLFIGKELTLAREVEKKVSANQVLDDVIVFLSQKVLSSEESLSAKLLESFNENLNLFVKDIPSSEIQVKMTKIADLLLDVKKTFHTKLNRILNKEVSSLTINEVDFLHRTVSYLALENLVLQQMWNVLAETSQYEKLMIDAQNKGVFFRPEEISMGSIPEWIFYMLGPQSKVDKKFNAIFEGFSNLCKVKYEPKHSAEYVNLIKKFFEYKKAGHEIDSAYIDTCLAVLKLKEMTPIDNKIHTDFNQNFLSFLTTILKKQTPLFDPSLEEMHSHLVQSADLIDGYLNATVKAWDMCIKQMPKDCDYNTDQKAHSLYVSMIESQFTITSDYLGRLQVLVNDYQEIFAKKSLMYLNAFSKLSLYQKSIGKKTKTLKSHKCLLDCVNKHLLPSIVETLPDPKVFKTQAMISPAPVKLSEDHIIEEMQTLGLEDLPLVSSKNKTKIDTAKQVPIPREFDITMIPLDIAMQVFSFLSVRNILNFGQTNHQFHQYAQQYFKSFPHLLVPKSLPLPIQNIPTEIRSINNNNSIYEVEDQGKNSLVPSLNRRSAPLTWCKNLQSLLNTSSDVRWVKKINTSPLGMSLEDPTSALDSVFKELVPLYSVQGFKQKNSALQKVIGWIIFAQKMHEIKQTNAKFEIIQKYELGKVLSKCAKLLHSIPQGMINDELIPCIAGQVVISAAQILETMAQYYFFVSSEGKDSLKPPKSTIGKDLSHPAIYTVLENVLEEKGNNPFAYVAASDSRNNRLMISKSGRMWAINPKEITEWKNARERSSYQYQKESLFFSSLRMEEITLRILFNNVRIFSQFCEANKDKVWPETITNFNKIRGDFVNTLATMHSTRPKVDDRMHVLSLFYRFFPDALSLKKWNALFHHFREDQVSQKSLMSIVMEGNCTKDQVLMMSLCYLPCGEIKIALDCCRELNIFTKEQVHGLPKTLGERLLFSAFQPIGKYDEKVRAELKTQELPRMDICQKCKDLWPVFESLYWSIRKCGIDLSVIEKLDHHIMQFYKKS